MSKAICSLALAMGLTCSTAFAAQSVQATSGNPGVTLPNRAPWTTIGQNTKSMRWEMRIHNFSGDFPVAGMTLGPWYLNRTGGGIWVQPCCVSNTFDTMGNNGVFINACCSQLSDVLIRVQRNANGGTLSGAQWTFEICPLPNGVCLSATNAITSYATVTNWQGTRIQMNSGYQMAFLRWFSGIVAVGTTIPLGGVSGDLANWEFEGNLNDSSGHGLNMNSGGVSFAATPIFPPACNAGTQQVFRAGAPVTLDGSRSQPLDETMGLTYLWQYVPPTQPGAPRQQLVWSSHATPQVTIRGMIFGPVNLQLTVTDGNGQSSTCTVHDGAVPTDPNGNVIIADPKVNLLLGPMTRMDRSCDVSTCTSSSLDPWPWADQIQFAFAYHFGQAQGTNPTSDITYVKQWETRTGAGTITVANGSSSITGTGTHFGTEFCGSSSSFPCAPLSTSNLIVIWHCTSGSAPTCFNSLATSGRFFYAISSVTSDTAMTIQSGVASTWILPTCTGCYYNAWSVNSWYNQGQTSTNNNYYDDVKSFYATYYRTGIEDFLGYARWLADAEYDMPIVDKFTCSAAAGWGCPVPRARSLEGIVLRAMDEDSVAGLPGSSAKWPNLRTYCTNVPKVEVIRDAAVGYIIDLREESYSMAELAVCAITDPGDNTNVDTWLTTGDNALRGRWTTQRHTDAYGPWTGIYCDSRIQAAPSCNDGTGITITAANGSPTVTISGGTWAVGNFCDAGNKAFITMGAHPITGGSWDQRGYIATFVNSTQATLDANYAGTSGSGKVYELGCGIYQPAGPATQPFMLGITSNMMRLWAYALANSGSAPPKDSAMSSTINATWLPAIANWLGTTAVNTKTYAGIPARGPWYFYGGAVCIAPYDLTMNGSCDQVANAQQARILSPELLAAISTGYCLNHDANLLTYGDNYYSAMFAKFPANSGYDGGWIADMDINGFFWGLYAGKWPGFFWGYGRTQSWVSARQGCVRAAISGIVSIEFNLASVPNATQVRVALTKPDGSTVTNTCTSSPCAVTADARQGSHLLTLTYLSAGGAMLTASTEVSVIDVN
jgi:hypothetical protein